jgi:predicted CXXCH cytochrome family protein
MRLMVADIRLYIAVAAILLLGAAPALAYQESSTSTDPSNTPIYSCPSCHGLESDTTSPTVAPRSGAGTRKGPHGGYTNSTSKCETCHSVHLADSPLLLPQPTITGTCNTCHDGTGGGGVYGVIERRTGLTPAGHRIDTGASGGKISVPGGDPNGGALERTFTGQGGSLTCTDCHNPHDADTVEAFVGDRVRSTNDTTTALATNRLLRKKPTSAETAVTAYGSDWCLGCHAGSSRGSMTHPVATKDTTFTADYMNVAVLAGYDTSAVAGAKGPLGGSNLGYVVPPGSDRAPICQQCHEDSRAIANDLSEPGTIDGTTEVFAPSVDGASAGNPTFQNFPHETVNASMLVEQRDSLCLNCHATDTGAAVH